MWRQFGAALSINQEPRLAPAEGLGWHGLEVEPQGTDLVVGQVLGERAGHERIDRHATGALSLPQGAEEVVFLIVPDARGREVRRRLPRGRRAASARQVGGVEERDRRDVDEDLTAEVASAATVQPA